MPTQAIPRVVIFAICIRLPEIQPGIRLGQRSFDPAHIQPELDVYLSCLLQAESVFQEYLEGNMDLPFVVALAQNKSAQGERFHFQ